MTAVDGRDTAMRRVHVAVHGTVQGVGFRPFVYRLASASRLTGFVRNDTSGVVIEVEGPSPSIDVFLGRLGADAPPHARVTRLDVREMPPRLGNEVFSVEPSTRAATTDAMIPADLATCDDCLRELFDPADRRHRYPFINCTACGPRFTIARDIPYDRGGTTMHAFAMCDACRAEYNDPRDRRFHAEPIACADCGPCVTLRDSRGAELARADDAIVTAARALRDGAIIAVKGLGGYHLAVRADADDAVRRLRERKSRDAKPFAVMVRDVEAARVIASLDGDESRLLASAARPIVLVRARPGAGISEQVAPRCIELGLMLPYTPLHHLLLAELSVPLVMTSGNACDEPIAYRDDDALSRLAPIADQFLTHDRGIEARCDDSVVRVIKVAGAPQTMVIRRSRGYVPEPIDLPLHAGTPILAVGGQLKNTACIARGADALVGPHGGDLDDWSAFGAYAAGIDHLERLAGVAGEIVAHDRHPEYASTRYAAGQNRPRTVAIQHHHAHLAACLAEHNYPGPAIGLIFDGAGLGTDGRIWGGEVLVGDLGGFTRLGRLREVPQPGGDAAVREPWRMACAWLGDATGGALAPLPRTLQAQVDAARWLHVHQLGSSAACAITSSAGRLLDACAALCGFASRISYEGQAAIELEAMARDVDGDVYPIDVEWVHQSLIIDPRPLIRQIVHDAAADRPLPEIAASVHQGLVYAARLAARCAAQHTGLSTIVLSGGVFQNALLLEPLSAALAHDGLRVLVPRRLPPNDGGLSYGQAVIAAWQETDHHVPRDSRPAR